MGFTNAWLEWIETETQNVPDHFFSSPLDEVGEGETVEGVLLEETTKRLYGLCRFLRSKIAIAIAEHLAKHHLPDHHRGACELHREEIGRLDKRADQVIGLFWHSVRHLFDMPDKDLGLRKDWQIISQVSPAEQMLEGIAGIFKEVRAAKEDKEAWEARMKARLEPERGH